jgi:hypothetical protein
LSRGLREGALGERETALHWLMERLTGTHETSEARVHDSADGALFGIMY